VGRTANLQAANACAAKGERKERPRTRRARDSAPHAKAKESKRDPSYAQDDNSKKSITSRGFGANLFLPFGGCRGPSWRRRVRRRRRGLFSRPDNLWWRRRWLW